MSRRKVVIEKRVVKDQRFNDPVAGKLISVLMVAGKKSVAERIFYNSLEIVKERVKEDPVKVFAKAVDNIKPVVEVKPRRVGGATYQIPIDVRSERRLALAIRWLIKFSKQRKERTMQEKLAGELVDAYNGVGGAIKKRDESHKMAEANKAFSHFRW